MPSDDLVFCPALQLRDRIRARQLSSMEITEAVLARIEQTQPTLNAFITAIIVGKTATSEFAHKPLTDAGTRRRSC